MSLQAIEPAEQASVLQPGEALVLKPTAAHQIVSGRVEIYASLGAAGESFGRRFLLELGAALIIQIPGAGCFPGAQR